MFNRSPEDFKQMKNWEKLKTQILTMISPSYRHSYKTLSFYDLVTVFVDEEGKPKKHKAHPDDVASFLVFTDTQQTRKMSRSYNQTEILKSEFDSILTKEVHTQVYMLGDLVECLANSEEVQSIKINPILWKEEGEEFPFILCEEVLFIPLFDKMTKKYMMTDPENAMALLAIDPNDQERFGIEIVFHALNYNDYSEEVELRQKQLKKELEKLSFYSARIPMRRGSGNFYCALLNLENPIEEMAFIREYPTFESFISPVFVTSGLELLSGNMEAIPYDGEKIDTIFTPLINWQKEKVKR